MPGDSNVESDFSGLDDSSRLATVIPNCPVDKLCLE